MQLSGDLLQAVDPVRFWNNNLLPDVDPLDPWQAETLRGSWQKILLNCCRQSGKSTTTAVLAYHMAKYTAGSLTLVLSPSLRQSGELFRKVIWVENRDESPLKKEEDSKLYVTYKNGSRIVSLPGKEGTVRGYSAVDLLIIDEASQVEDELYGAVSPMLAVSGGRLALISTPHGKRGFFHHEWAEGGDEWFRVQITANDCPRITEAFLAAERRKFPEWFIQQEYFCQFVETEDQVFRYEDIRAAVSGDVDTLIKGPAGHGIKPLFAGSL